MYDLKCAFYLPQYVSTPVIMEGFPPCCYLILNKENAIGIEENLVVDSSVLTLANFK